ncbi:MAG: lysostaphin resistance A-like protein [Mariniblastus sp.]
MSYPNATPEPDSKIEKPDVNVLWVGLIVEGGMIFLALILAWFNFYDHGQPLSELQSWPYWQTGLIWGPIATIPALSHLVLFHYWKPKFYSSMQEIVDTKLKPMFQSSSLVELFIISLMAGFCEELLFRWCLQGGITSFLEPAIGRQVALIIGLGIASLAFGLCHWVNWTYMVTTLVIGVFMGGLMIATNNWLVPAVAHALYDFVALVYIARWRKT